MWEPIILCLLDEGLSVDPCDLVLVMFLHIVCIEGNIEYVQKLVEAGVDIHTSPPYSCIHHGVFGLVFHAAVAVGCVNTIKDLIEHVADVYVSRANRTSPQRRLCDGLQWWRGRSSFVWIKLGSIPCK